MNASRCTGRPLQPHNRQLCLDDINREPTDLLNASFRVEDGKLDAPDSAEGAVIGAPGAKPVHYGLALTSPLKMRQSGIAVLRHDQPGPVLHAIQNSLRMHAVGSAHGGTQILNVQRSRIPIPKAGRCRLGELPETLLALAQCRFGPSALHCREVRSAASLTKAILLSVQRRDLELAALTANSGALWRQRIRDRSDPMLIDASAALSAYVRFGSCCVSSKIKVWSSACRNASGQSELRRNAGIGARSGPLTS